MVTFSRQASETGAFRCPKCRAELQLAKLRTTSVQRCPSGCGVWINQVEIDGLQQRPVARKSQEIKDIPVGLWRARRLVRS